MVVDKLTDKLLEHELQLGEQLNSCVHQERRSDFSLMLAMLTDDVRNHSQFLLPQTEQEEHKTTDEALRKCFSLPKETPLALQSLDEIDDYNQAQLIVEQQLSQIKLTDALAPKPLTFRDDAKHIDQQVLSNTSLHCQKHYRDNAQQKTTRMGFEAVQWLNALQNSIVKSTLFTA